MTSKGLAKEYGLPDIRVSPATRPFEPPKTFDLSVARPKGEEWDLGFSDNISVITITGTATIKINTLASGEVDLTRVRKITGKFNRIWVFNTAQAGKTLIMLAGRAVWFSPEVLQTRVSILDTSGVEVDPVTKQQLTPLEKANEHNIAVVAATDILASALAPTNTPCLFRVMVTFDDTAVFRVITTKGGNPQRGDFNSGEPLVAYALYIFDHLIHLGDTVNYQFMIGSNALVLRIQEVKVAVQ